MAGVSDPVQDRPCGSGGAAGAVTFLMAMRGALTSRFTFAVWLDRLVTVAEQCAAPVGPKASGEHVCARVTFACVLTKATGMVTGVPFGWGVSVIRPRYWPLGTEGALIVMG